MAEKITLTGVWRNDRTSAAGKPFVSVSVKCREYGDKYLSGFGSAWNQAWKAGDEVDVDIVKKPGTDKNGKPVEYLNFSKPDPIVDLTKHYMALATRMAKVEQQLKELTAPRKATPAELPEPPDYEDINAELAGHEPDESEPPF